MLSEPTKFIYDSALLGFSERTTRQKLSIWRSFAHLSLGLPRHAQHAVLAGFHVSYFSKATVTFLFREIFVRQVYRPHIDNPNPVILDCGANLGMATLFFKFLYPRCRVKCFEPDPSTFQLLQTNVHENRLEGVETFNVALWDEDSSVEFFSDPAQQGNLRMSTNSGRLSGPPIKVRTRRLSEFIDGKVDYLKLDVEGAELRVMQELSDSGRLSNVHEVAIEYHHRIPGEQSSLSNFLRILEENGFEYQIAASGFPNPSTPRFQDIMIYARQTLPKSMQRMSEQDCRFHYHSLVTKTELSSDPS